MNLIRAPPKATANSIATDEVMRRPAAVVREAGENALLRAAHGLDVAMAACPRRCILLIFTRQSVLGFA